MNVKWASLFPQYMTKTSHLIWKSIEIQNDGFTYMSHCIRICILVKFPGD